MGKKLDPNWWKNTGFLKFPQAQKLDSIARSCGFVPSSKGHTKKVRRFIHMDNDLPLDVEPNKYGANIWTYIFDAPEGSFVCSNYLPHEGRNSNLQALLNHESIPEDKEGVSAWKMEECNDSSLRDFENLLQAYIAWGNQKYPMFSNKKEKIENKISQIGTEGSSLDVASSLKKKLEFLEKEDLQSEEIREAKQRKYQNKLREFLLDTRKHCEVSRVQTKELLVASHIKPWKDCREREKYDPDNLLLLSAHFDKLFDRGLISFQNNGKILISPHLSKPERERLNLYGNEKLENLPSSKMCDYLKFHRKLHGFE